MHCISRSSSATSDTAANTHRSEYRLHSICRSLYLLAAPHLVYLCVSGLHSSQRSRARARRAAHWHTCSQLMDVSTDVSIDTTVLQSTACEMSMSISMSRAAFNGNACDTTKMSTMPFLHSTLQCTFPASCCRNFRRCSYTLPYCARLA